MSVQTRQAAGNPAGGQYAATEHPEPLIDLVHHPRDVERVRAIEGAVTDAVLAAYPTAAGWETTTTNEDSRRPWHYYWADEIDVHVPQRSGRCTTHAMTLDGTTAAGAIYEMNSLVYAVRDATHFVPIVEGFEP